MDLSKWDINQVGTLVEAYSIDEFDDEDAIEQMSGNGMIDDILYRMGTPKFLEIADRLSMRRNH